MCKLAHFRWIANWNLKIAQVRYRDRVSAIDKMREIERERAGTLRAVTRLARELERRSRLRKTPLAGLNWPFGWS